MRSSLRDREPLITNEFFALIEHFNAELGQPEQKVVLANPKLAFTVKPPVTAAVKEAAITEPKPSDEELKFRNLPEDSVRRTATTTSLTVK
jgi:hypothetical protein